VSTTPLSPAVPLQRSVLRDLAGRLSVPTYDPRQLRPGVLHVGVGRFHRSHQARYFDDLAQTCASTQWGVVGAGMSSHSTSRGLARQDHLHTVVEAGPAGTTARVVGVLRDHLTAAADRAALIRLLSGEELQLVTLTVTAEAYAADAAAGDDSVFALLATALDARRRAGLRPFTVLSCDNVAGGVANGAAAQQAVGAAAYRRGPAGPRLAAWLEEHGAFPASMADRITPVLDEADTRLLVAEFGVLDPFAVLAEPYREWVVEDRFCAERPPLDEVGVRFVTDIRPYVEAKTRVVNGAHCAVGYLGRAAGYSTAAAAMADPAISRFVEDLLREEVAPGLRRPDRDAYIGKALARIANPALADPLERLSRRGSVRIPAYVAPALVEALDAGRPAPRLTTVLAGWLHHLRTVGTASEDARAAELLPLARHAERDPRPFLRAVCGLEALAGRPALVADLRHTLLCLETNGLAAALQRGGATSADALQVVPGPRRVLLRRRRTVPPQPLDDGTLDAVS
jgi:mannitol 2-dehydrogenase